MKSSIQDRVPVTSSEANAGVTARNRLRPCLGENGPAVTAIGGLPLRCEGAAADQTRGRCVVHGVVGLSSASPGRVLRIAAAVSAPRAATVSKRQMTMAGLIQTGIRS